MPHMQLTLLFLFSSTHTLKGHAVVQLVETLRYKSEVRGFDSR